jgi:hypothetical protein
MKIAFKPRFVPSRTFTHDIAGRIDEYHFTRNKWWELQESAERGVQSFFIPNNAKPHHRNHYALKVYRTLTEAVAAWQRQGVAARRGIAPPVRRICKFVIENLGTRWGYQSCVASHVGCVGGWDDWGSRAGDRLDRELSRVDISGTVNDQEHKRYDGIRRSGRLGKRARILGDLHSGNVGFFKHRLVCIDFGTESIDFR